MHLPAGAFPTRLCAAHALINASHRLSVVTRQPGGDFRPGQEAATVLQGWADYLRAAP